MKYLNNKGITTIELLLCFVLVMVMTLAMYGSISSFNDKRVVEQYKEKVYSYKEVITKDIQSDLIKIGVTKAKHNTVLIDNSNKANYADKPVGTVVQTLTCELKDGSIRELRVYKDQALIEYGRPDSLMQYPLPDIDDLVINNVKLVVQNDSVLSIYIGLYHPISSTRYAISMICPINYINDKRGDYIFAR